VLETLRMRLSLGLLIVACALAGCGGGDGGGSSSSTGTGTGTGTTSGGSGTSGTGGGSGSGSGGSSPSGTPTLVQKNVYQTQNADTENNSTVAFTKTTTKGNTIWVAVTVADFGGIHTISISDTQGNTYTQLDQQNDGQPGSQSVAQFYAANIAGDTSTPDTITVNWGNDDYKGILITEISGVTATPLVGHASNLQDALAAGTSNDVTSGAISVASTQTPALLLAVSMNTTGGASDTGGSGAGGPAAGSGMTPVATFWDWGANLGTFVTATITSAESVSAVFNSPDTDSYLTVAAVFH
jgi:hypothetical protein